MNRTAAALAVLVLMVTAGCETDEYAADHYGPAPDVYYDGFYGDYPGGYWGDDGYFYYSDRRGGFDRDDGHHFHRRAFRGGRGFHSLPHRGGHNEQGHGG